MTGEGTVGSDRFRSAVATLKSHRYALYGVFVGLLTGVVVTSIESWMRFGAVLLLAPTLALIGVDVQRSVPSKIGALRREVSNVTRATMRLRDQVAALDSLTRSSAQAMVRIEQAAAQTRAAVEVANIGPESASGRTPRVLFVTSNGSGMGHLTRLMAVAKAGRDSFESVFLSLSTAAEMAAKQGFETFAVESQSTSGLTWSEWNRRFSEVLDVILVEIEATAVVFDGVQVYRGIYERARARGIPLVWMCRGLWKATVPREQVRAWRDAAELLVHPSEGALATVAESLPAEPEGCVIVPPITLTTPGEVRRREEATDALGLDPNRRHVLVQLGSGALGSRAHEERAAVESVLELGPEWQPVVLRSPLSSSSEPVAEGAVELTWYPIAPYIRAFEFSINAAGYNTVHENVFAGHPAVYVPDENMLADDQGARANALVGHKAGLVAHDEESLRRAVRSLADPGIRVAIGDAIKQLAKPSGAEPAASAIARVAQRGVDLNRLNVRRMPASTRG